MTTPARIALVTGANKGIGFYIAKKLGAAGVHVLVGARDAGRGEEAVATLRKDGGAFDLVPVDVTEQTSIDAAAAHVTSKFGHLDVLVNNAGISVNGDPPSKVKVDDLRKTFETNVFGVVGVTNAFLPLLRKSDAPRIVNVTSGLGSIGLMTDPNAAFYRVNIGSYQASKTALNAITAFLAKELRDTPFKVNVVCPGFRATDLAGPGVNASQGAGDPADGADIAVKMALLGADGPTGGYFASDGSRYPW